MRVHYLPAGPAAIRLAGLTALAMLAVLPAVGASVTADSGYTFRVVALTGTPAPGTEAGTTFSSFITAVDLNLLKPQIDTAGDVAFFAFLEGSGVDASNRSGIWSELGAVLELNARTGDAAPGTAPGVHFFGLPNEEVPLLPPFVAGRLGIAGVLAGEGVTVDDNEGVWKDDAGDLLLVGRKGHQVPDQLAGVTFSSVSPLTLDAAGSIYLSAVISGTGVDGGSNEGLWSDRAGSLQTLLREGDMAPGLSPGVLIGRTDTGISHVFPAFSANSQGQFAVNVLLKGAGVSTVNDEILYLSDSAGNALAPVFREGDPAPGLGAGVIFGGGSGAVLSHGIALNEAGAIAFNSRVGGALPSQTVMFSTVDGSLLMVARPGDPAPGTATEFSFFGAPVLNQASEIAFTAALPGDLFNPPHGIWFRSGGVLQVLTLPGDSVAHMSGAFTMVRPESILSLRPGGEILFKALLSNQAAGTVTGLVSTAPGEPSFAVIAEGDLFDLHGDQSEFREVLRIISGTVNAAGEVALRLDFTDGSSGHFATARDRDGDSVADGRDNCTLVANGDQRDTNGDGFGNACDPDLNNDGFVNFEDLAQIKSLMFSGDPDADFTGDGVVNFVDVGVMKSLFFGAPGPSALAP